MTRATAVSCPRIIQFIISFSNETESVSGDLPTILYKDKLLFSENIQVDYLHIFPISL